MLIGSNLTNPSVVAKILKDHGLRLNKGLGQNFLIDGNTRKVIVDAAELRRSDVLLEIGGGIGTMTQAVAPLVSKMFVIEIDGRFAAIIDENLKEIGNLEIIQGDAMKLDLEKYVREWGVNKVVSNLPYHIASPLIIDMLEFSGRVLELMVLMVQKEVAERLQSGPGDENYGVSSVLTQVLSIVEVVHKVGKKVFIPQPKVDSAVIKIEPLGVPEGYPFLKKVVKSAFSQRRKKGAKLLSYALGLSERTVRERFSQSNLSAELRAEDISPAAFLLLSRKLEEVMA